MKSIKKAYSILGSLVLVGTLWLPVELQARAEDVIVPGYHEYTETENEMIDNWYGIARGTYLKSGTSGIKIAAKGKVNISGTTTAHSVCDEVRVSIHLDESSDGGNSFEQIGSYYFSENNTSSCHGSKANISVTSGWYYMTRAGHSVTKGSSTEMSTTQTKAMKVS